MSWGEKICQFQHLIYIHLSTSCALSHVVFGVKDLAASRRFYVDILGLQVTDETDDAVYLRALEERGTIVLS